MFSGIVEEYAEVVRIVKDQENLHLSLKCSFVDELKIDQSVSHNGVCLTVVSIQDGTYTVTAMKETIERSNIGLLKVGDKVNVERSMMMNGRLDGHIVQGHVDQTAECIQIQDAEGSWYCKSDCLQPNRRQLPGSHYTIYLRTYQFPHFPSRKYRKYRI